MYALFKCEFKKLISKRNLIMYIILLLVVFSYLLVTMILNNPVTDKDNKMHYGLQEIRSRMTGETYLLTDEKVKECFKKTKFIFLDDNNFDSNGIMKPTVYEDDFVQIENLANLLIQVHSPIGTFEPDILIDKNEEDITLYDLYKCRIDKIKTLLENSQYNEKEKNFIMNKTLKLKTANTMYGNTRGMNQILKNNSMIYIFILIFCSIVLSPIFSRDHQLKFSSILKSTKFRKSKDIWAKIMAGMTITLFIYLSILSIALLLQFSIIGINNLSLPIQTNSEFWLSIFPYTFQKALIISISLSFFATISFSCIVLLVSSFNKKDHIALLLSFSILFVPKFLYDSNICKFFMNLTPIKAIDFSNYLRSFDNIIYSCFGHQFLNVEIVFFFNILLIVASISICFLFNSRSKCK